MLLGAHTLGGKGFGDATSFDNSYFSILLERPWNDTSNKMAYMIGLPSDKAIVEDSGAQKYVVFPCCLQTCATFFVGRSVQYRSVEYSTVLYRTTQHSTVPCAPRMSYPEATSLIFFFLSWV